MIHPETLVSGFIKQGARAARPRAQAAKRRRLRRSIFPPITGPQAGVLSGGRKMSDSDDRWLTYNEAATALGIKPDSVRRRATARKWPRRQGNDGLARVLLPPDAMPQLPPDDGAVDAPAFVPALSPDPGLIERAARAEARADALGAQVKDLRADRDAWRAMAEKLAAGDSDAGTARPSSFLERFFFKKKLR